MRSIFLSRTKLNKLQEIHIVTKSDEYDGYSSFAINLYYRYLVIEKAVRILRTCI